MSDVHVQKSNRGRKKTLTNSTRKQHKKDNSVKYNKTRVCKSDEYDRWTELKDVLQIKKKHTQKLQTFCWVGRFISRVISSVLVLNY